MRPEFNYRVFYNDQLFYTKGLCAVCCYGRVEGVSNTDTYLYDGIGEVFHFGEPIMESSNFFDKDNKEIYESDYCLYKNESKVLIEKKEGCLGFYHEHKFHVLHTSYCEYADLKIIGNLYNVDEE